MKSSFALALAGLICAAAHGQGLKDSFWLGGHLGEYRFEAPEGSSSNAGSVTQRGLQFGYRPARAWSVQGWWGRGNTATLPARDPAHLDLALVGLRRHLPRLVPGSGWEPYLGIDGAELVIEPETGEGVRESMFGGELGIQRRLTSGMWLDAGARSLYSGTRENWDTAFYITLNLVLTGGPAPSGTAATPVPQGRRAMAGPGAGRGATPTRDCTTGRPGAGVARTLFPLPSAGADPGAMES